LPISNGASPIASALGIRLGATPRGRIHLISQPRLYPTKQDISTLLALGHFYFALTVHFYQTFRPPHQNLWVDSGSGSRPKL
jgi:hypothetical protein